MTMDFKRMFKKENNNYNKIYLYLDTEKKLYSAYEFSAYMLTRMFDTQKLSEEVRQDMNTILYVVRLTPPFVVEQFSGNNITVGDRFIKVVLDDPSRCIQWKAEFSELKKQRQMDHCVSGKNLLDKKIDYEEGF